ncbi:MAG: amidohydrolase family protein, partial [Candidatus Ventricola sp.]
MLTVFTDARVILEDRVMEGYVAVKDGLIAALGEGAPDLRDARVISLGGRYLAPGFIEMHTHGAGGCDFMDGTPEAMRVAAMTHLAHGTTTLFPTTLAATREEILRSIDALRQARQAMADGPRMPGLHMEGPYLNVKQKGAIDAR